ncbi:sn-1-specific diacylglycerol lipase ABHD11 [Dendropsophus ebraccatus]|uniref:sn-1-specific diacylglycerol lipase ABHD11 n=1 Tax=Dendropsophus ebraccatus TaxID=150705 RepID=UPI003831C998
MIDNQRRQEDTAGGWRTEEARCRIASSMPASGYKKDTFRPSMVFISKANTVWLNRQHNDWKGFFHLNGPKLQYHTNTENSVVTLSYDLYEGKKPGPPLVLLHGLFGSKSNFQSIARALVRRIGRTVLTLDARNHGSSPHCDTITYPAMSADVCHLLQQLNIDRCVLIGHSMGGKTAMTVALQEPHMVERLVSVDISPSPTTPQTGFPQYIKAMQNVHLEGKMPRSTARRLAEEQLSAIVKEPSVRQFLLTNLVQENGHFKWRVNLDAVSNHLLDLLDFPEFHSSYPGPALFLGGANSPYISSENYPDIERLFPCANVEYIEGAGHWVHAEKTQDFLHAICNFVEST